MKNKLVIIGCGGHARSVADVYLFNNPDAEIVFVEENAKDGEEILGFPALKSYDIKNEKVFIAIGDNKARESELKKHKTTETIVSKKACIGKDVELGNGVFIAHEAHVGVGSKIGEGTIINSSALVDHEVLIGKNCHIAPNSTICGRCTIGKNTFVGAGATIIDKLTISDNVTVGAGAVVIKNIDKPGTYVGNPARKIK